MQGRPQRTLHLPLHYATTRFQLWEGDGRQVLLGSLEKAGSGEGRAHVPHGGVCGQGRQNGARAQAQEWRSCNEHVGAQRGRLGT